MSKATLVIITGNSASGKTTLAGQLSEKYKLPYISKDSIKERVFDVLGTKDKAWSLKVSAVSHRVMDDFIAQELNAGRSLIVESNFKVEIDSERFQKLLGAYNADCVQILCKASGDVLFDRWNARIAQGTRHKGHVEAVSLEQIRQDLHKPYPPLELPGKLIEVDTSDIDRIQLPQL